MTILFKNYDFVALYQKKPTCECRDSCPRVVRVCPFLAPIISLFRPSGGCSGRCCRSRVAHRRPSFRHLHRASSLILFKLETQRTLLCLVFPPGALPGRHTHAHARAASFPARHLDARLESVLSTQIKCLCDACCARFSSTQLILLFLFAYFWTEFFFSARKHKREKVSPSKRLTNALLFRSPNNKGEERTKNDDASVSRVVDRFRALPELGPR